MPTNEKDADGNRVYGTPQTFTPPKAPGNPEAPAQEGPILSDDGMFYWDDRQGWRPTERYRMAQAEAEAQDRSAQEAMQAETEARYSAAAQQGKLAQAWAGSRDMQNTAETERRNSQWTTAAGNRAALGSDYTKQLQDWQGQMVQRQANLDALKTDPSRWIDYWNTLQTPAPKQPEPPLNMGQDVPTAQNSVDAAQKGYQRWVTPEQLQTAQTGVSMERLNVWDPSMGAMRPENDDEFRHRTQTLPGYKIWQGSDGMSQIQNTDPLTQRMVQQRQQIFPGQPIPETSAREIALGDVLRGTPWGSVGSANMQAILDTQGANTGISQEQIQALRNLQNQRLEGNPAGTVNIFPKAVGPQSPDFAASVLPQNLIRNNQVDVGNLRPGSVRAPSASQYQLWNPTQRAGYEGLVRASGRDPEEAMEELNRTWGSSRRGQAATQRARSY